MHTLNPSPKKNIQESQIVSSIDKALEEYIEECGGSYSSMRPANNTQAFYKDLDQFCGDLVAAWNNLTALVLEVKFADHGRIDEWDANQAKGLVELEGRGIPIYFSYNLEQPKNFSLVASTRLTQFSGVPPSKQLNSSIKNTDLKSIVDKLLSGAATAHFDQTISLASFVKTQNEATASNIQELTTKVLLLIYDRSNRKLMSLDYEAASLAVENILAASFVAAIPSRKLIAMNIAALAQQLSGEVEIEYEARTEGRPPRM